MTFVRYLAWTVLGLASVVSAQGPPTVSTKDGTYYGVSSSGFKQDWFLGIPYAQPPTGNLRLAKPVALNGTFAGSRNATSFGPGCLQYMNTTFPTNEDCLSLNVIRPAGISNSSSLPVLIYIHGGGFFFGSGSDQRYNGTYLVQSAVAKGTPMIYVTLNYRLGPFGFTASNEIKAAGLLNLGLYDQRLALTWIKNNIASFGGSADKITIFGESAGGTSVVLQMFAYNGRDDGLFRYAAADSAIYCTLVLVETVGSRSTLTDLARGLNYTMLQPGYNALVNGTNCYGNLDVLGCLRAAPLSTFIQAGASVIAMPTPDGDLFTDWHKDQLNNGKYVNVPFLLGNVNDEGTLPLIGTPQGVQNDTAFNTYALGRLLGAQSNATQQKMLQLYPNDPAQGSPFGTGEGVLPTGLQDKRAAWINGDVTFFGPRRQVAQAVAKNSGKVFSFRFNQVPQNGTMELGVFHTSELEYIFRILDPGPTARYRLGNRPKDYALSSLMHDYYINFAIHGDPNVGSNSSLYWPSYSSGQQNIVFQGTTSYIEKDDFRKDQLAEIATFA